MNSRSHFQHFHRFFSLLFLSIVGVTLFAAFPNKAGNKLTLPVRISTDGEAGASGTVRIIAERP